jgi:hypothetical protein
MTDDQWVQVINSVGVVGVLFMNVWFFISGRIVPLSVVDRILLEAEKRTTRMADEIKDGIKAAVKEAIVQGIHEIRNQDNEKKDG